MIDTSKEFVKSFSWTSLTENRETEKEVTIAGRKYYKTGKEQAVTFVGNLYKISGAVAKYVLYVGMAKQHPDEHNVMIQDGIDAAAQNAYTNPMMIMEVFKDFDYNAFSEMMITYWEYMPLDMLRTNQERAIARFENIIFK